MADEEASKRPNSQLCQTKEGRSARLAPGKCPFSNPGPAFRRLTGQPAVGAHSQPAAGGRWRNLRRKLTRRALLDPNETPSEQLFAISEDAELHYARTVHGWVLYEIPAHEATLIRSMTAMGSADALPVLVDPA